MGCVYMCMSVGGCECMCLCVYMCVYACACECICQYLSVCFYVHAWVCVRVYTWPGPSWAVAVMFLAAFPVQQQRSACLAAVLAQD